MILNLNEKQVATLKEMIEGWVDENWSDRNIPYPTEYYDIFEALEITTRMFNITRPEV